MVASFRSNTREKKKWQPTQEYIHSKKKKKSARYDTQKLWVIYGINPIAMFKKKQTEAVPKINQEEGNLSQGSKQLLLKYFFQLWIAMGDPLCIKSSSEENIPGWLWKHWGDYVTPVKNPSAIHLCTDKEPVLNLPSQLKSLLPFSDYSIYLPWSNKHTVLLGYLFLEITKRRHGYLRSYLVSTTSALLFPISV